MDKSTNDAADWGVVYSYGSVLALFDTEQDARNEATCYGGAVVSLARQVWSAISEAASAELQPDQPKPA
jgi:hypothetical protein